MVAMTPLIAIQILGLVYKIKQSGARAEEIPAVDAVDTDADGQVIMTFDATATTEDKASEIEEDIIDF